MLKSRIILIFYIIFSVSILILGYLYYSQQWKDLKSKINNELISITELKSSEIQMWIDERIADTYVLSESPSVIDAMNDSNSIKKQTLLTKLQRKINSVQKAYNYEDVIVLDTLYHTIANCNKNTGTTISKETQLQLNKCKINNKVSLSDLYWCNLCKTIHFDLIAPLLNNNKLIGFTILRNNPNDYLFKLIKKWPTFTKSGETYIIRPEDDSIVFLNPMRNIKNEALRYKFPIINSKSPAIEAINGRLGIYEGPDFLNKEVLAYSIKIPQLNWILISKVDEKEIYNPVYIQSRNTALLLILFLMLLGSILLVLRNIDKKNYYKNLFKLEQRLKLFVEYAPAAIAMFDKNMNYIATSRRFLQDYNLTETNIIGRSHYDVFPEISDNIKNIHKRCLNGATVKEDASCFIRADGSVDWVKWEIIPWYESPKKIGGILLLSEVITERIIAAEAIKNSQQSFIRVFESNPAALIIVKFKDHKIVNINNAYTRIIGYKPHEVIGNSWNNKDIFIDQSEWEVINEKIKNNESIRDKEIKLKSKSGKILDVIIHIELIQFDNELCILAAMLNISDRKKAEFELATSKAKLEAALSSMADALLISDAEGNFLHINNAFALFHNFRNTTECPKNWKEYTSKIDFYYTDKSPVPIDKLIINRALNGETSSNEEYILARKDIIDDSWYGSFSFAPIRDKHTIIGFVMACKDITHFKLMLDTLTKSEERFEQIVKQSQTVIWEINEDGIFTYMSPLIEEIFGYKPLDLIDTKYFYDLHPENGKEEFKNLILTIFKNKGTFKNFINPIVSPNGLIFWVETNAVPIFDGNGSFIGYLGSIKDITELKNAEEAILTREEELHHAQEIAQMGSWSIDFSTNLIIASKNQLKLLGFDDNVEKLDYDTFLNNVHPEDKYLITNNYWTFDNPDKSVTFDFRYIMPDGSIKWLQNNLIPVLKDGNIIGLKGTNIDITDQKLKSYEIQRLNNELELRIEKRTAELSDLYNNSPIGYHSLNTEGVFEIINNTELQWFGYTREEVIHKMKATDLLTESSKILFKQHFPVFKETGKLENIELDFIRKDGTIMTCLVNATAIYDYNDNFVKSRSTLTDHTERKKAEENLKKAKEELEATNKELEAFSYSVSHDLRAPLRAIDNFSRILEEEYEVNLDDEGKRLLQIIIGNSRKMGLLIDDLLSFSRLGRAGIKLYPVDMESTVKTILDDVMNPLQKEYIVIQIEQLSEAYCDHSLIKQVWVNLISNAIKFSSKKENPEIKIFSEKNENFIIYCVKDNGTGFDMKYYDKLFGVFQRLHSDKDFEGTGVGLAIVKRIIEKHGGSVWAKSELNLGSEFCFSLPIIS